MNNRILSNKLLTTRQHRPHLFIAIAGLLLFSAQLASAAFTGYDARIKEKEVLTPEPEKAPRINGPRVYGVRPGKIFIYRIPCQGERPIKFTAEGLPKSLKLNADKGIITGKAPAKAGEFKVHITAQNSHGKVKRPFRIVVGNRIALTPPTGWNSWGGHMVDVSDKVMRKAADLFVSSGLADVGFRYIGIDDCWMRLTQEMYDTRNKNVVKKHAAYDYKSTGTIGPVRDQYGNIQPNGKFPDMKAMTDYIHSFGLKAGIYSGPGKRTCQGWAASGGHQYADASQYAAWGFDLLKYDLCSGGREKRTMKKEIPGFKTPDFWKPMSDYLRMQERDILFNLCQYGKDDPWTWAPGLGIQSWRIGGDLNHHVDHYFDQALRIAGPLRQYSAPGHWNDPDFMYIHRIKDVWKMGEPSEEIPLNTNQRYQYVTLWSIVCAPFFFSCDIENIDNFTIRLLANADLLNINQDELGHVAELVRDENNQTVMLKNLADGSLVLAVFNRSPDKETLVEVDWEELGSCCELQVFDVWRQKDIGTYKGGISVRLSPHGVGLFKLHTK